MALNVSSPTTDIGTMARFFAAANFSPAGSNFEHWKDDKFEADLDTLGNATDPATIQAAYRAAQERLVDDPPWLYIVHDLNPRALSKKVHGLVAAQSWFIDLSQISLQ
jgi:peptide/nickel transport system substrate-binding protein